jgi:Sel1 repeat
MARPGVLSLAADKLRWQLVLPLGHVWLSAAVLPPRPTRELLQPKRRHISLTLRHDLESDMSTASPWGDLPEMKRPGHPRRNAILVILLLLLLLLGYLGGSYLVRHALADTQMRLDLASKALSGGFDRMAVKLLTPLAEKGDAQAQYRLAILYEQGWGTPRDGKRAVGLYGKAANQRLVSAQDRLGEIYLRGTLVLQDLAKARQWFEKAAMAGNLDAQLELAHIYEHGLGVTQDHIEAYAWNAVAAATGDTQAADQRDRNLRTLSVDDQVKAEARANALVAAMKARPASSAQLPPST